MPSLSEIAAAGEVLKAWPVYITDDNVIYCNHDSDCEPYFTEIIGRRVDFVEVMQALIRHILKFHPDVLTL